jgi:hypothetical protein
MAIYRAVMNGTYMGQNIVNNLYYRTGVGFDLDGLSLGGAKELALCIKNQVWPKWKFCMTSEYKLEDITVYPYHDGTFDLMYQNPWTENVMEAGNGPAETDGPGICAILKFNLEGTAILTNGIKPPKRGYVAVGPIQSAWIDNSGALTDTVFLPADSRLNELGVALAGNLESLLPPVIFFPVRVSQKNILGIWKPVSFADVNGVKVRRRTSFRRSRMIE